MLNAKEYWQVKDYLKKRDQQHPGGTYGNAWKPANINKEELLDDSPEAIKKRYAELRDKLRHADKSGG